MSDFAPALCVKLAVLVNSYFELTLFWQSLKTCIILFRQFCTFRGYCGCPLSGNDGLFHQHIILCLIDLILKSSSIFLLESIEAVCINGDALNFIWSVLLPGLHVNT